MANNYQGGGDTIFNYGAINRVAERETARQASVADAQQKARDAQTKELSTMSAKIKLDGIRDKDIKPALEKYQEFKDLQIQVAQAPNRLEAARLMAEASNKIVEFQTLANASKNVAGVIKDGYKRLGDNSDRRSTEQYEQAKAVDGMSTREIEEKGIDLHQVFKLGYKKDTFSTTMNTINGALQKAANTTIKEGQTLNVGGKRFTSIEKVGKVVPEQAYSQYVQQYNTSETFRDSVKDLAKEANMGVPAFLQKYALDNADKYQPTTTSSIKETSYDKVKATGDGSGGKGKKGEDDIYIRNQDLDVLVSGSTNDRISQVKRLNARLTGKGGFKLNEPVETEVVVNENGKEVKKRKTTVYKDPVSANNLGGNKTRYTVAPLTYVTEDIDGAQKARNIPARSVVVDNNKPQEARVILNELLNSTTGEKIADSKMRTNNASGKVTPPKAKTSTVKKGVLD